MDLILNLFIFLLTAGLLVSFSRQEGKWAPGRLKKAFRYFTCQSNVLCAAACLLTAVFLPAGELPEWVWLLKYAGTAAVSVTMLTVFLFLAPSIGRGWAEKLITGTAHDFCMHLLTPVLALVSFCVFEKKDMSFPQALIGMLPVILYGILYIYKVKYAPEEKRWEDFYGFGRNGKLPVSLAGMTAGTFLVCMALMALSGIQ